MITGARYLAWAFGALGVLFSSIPIAYLLSGRPEFTLNGEVVRSPAQAREALLFLFALVFVCSVVLLGTSKRLIARSTRHPAIVSWLETEPIWPTVRTRWFYAASLLEGLVAIAFVPDADTGDRLLLLVGLPFMFPLGWAMIWAVLGFQLINPISWFLPQTLRFGAYFFLFATWVSVALGPLSLAVAAAEQSESAWVLAAVLGSAVGSGHFLRFWLHKAFEITGPPERTSNGGLQLKPAG